FVEGRALDISVGFLGCPPGCLIGGSRSIVSLACELLILACINTCERIYSLIAVRIRDGSDWRCVSIADFSEIVTPLTRRTLTVRDCFPSIRQTEGIVRVSCPIAQ